MAEDTGIREPILPTPAKVIETDTLKGVAQRAFEKISQPAVKEPETRKAILPKGSQVIDVDVEKAKATVGKYFRGENPVPIGEAPKK